MQRQTPWSLPSRRDAEDPIGGLFAEHRVLLTRLQELEVELLALRGRSPSATGQRVDAVTRALRALTDMLTTHARKEDEAIFPVLRAGLDMPLFWGAIAREDRELQEQFPALEEALRQWQAAGWWGAWRARARFLSRGFGLLRLLRGHIRNEESFLNGYAYRHLTRAEHEEIARRLRALANEALAPG